MSPILLESIKYQERYGFLNMNVELEILGNFEFWGYQICQQNVHKITEFHSHFQLKSQWEGRIHEF